MKLPHPGKRGAINSKEALGQAAGDTNNIAGEGAKPDGNVKYSLRPDTTHGGKTLQQVLDSRDPPMSAYNDIFDTAKMDLAAMCAVAQEGGKRAIQAKLAEIAVDVRPGHPRPRKRLTERFEEACKQ